MSFSHTQSLSSSLLSPISTDFIRSSVVEKVLLEAHEVGKTFSVVVVDSKPLLEGL